MEERSEQQGDEPTEEEERLLRDRTTPTKVRIEIFEKKRKFNEAFEHELQNDMKKEVAAALAVESKKALADAKALNDLNECRDFATVRAFVKLNLQTVTVHTDTSSVSDNAKNAADRIWNRTVFHANLEQNTDYDSRQFLDNATKAILLYLTLWKSPCSEEGLLLRGPDRMVKNHKVLAGNGGARPGRHEVTFHNSIVSKLLWIIANGPFDSPPRGKKRNKTLGTMRSKIRLEVCAPLAAFFVKYLNPDKLLNETTINKSQVGEWEFSYKKRLVKGVWTNEFVRDQNLSERDTKILSGVFLPYAILAAKLVPGCFDILFNKMVMADYYCSLCLVNNNVKHRVQKEMWCGLKQENIVDYIEDTS